MKLRLNLTSLVKKQDYWLIFQILLLQSYFKFPEIYSKYFFFHEITVKLLKVRNFENVVATFDISSLEFIEMHYFLQNKKIVNLGHQKFLICVFFGKNLKKIIVIFEISTV